jgi:hypothetical protein
MSTGPTVVVNKGGFFASLVKGIFGTITVTIVCATALGLYGMHTIHRYLPAPTELLAQIPNLLDSLPEWREMPPIVADLLNDRRDLDYGKNLIVKSPLRMATNTRSDDRDGVAEIEVTNTGKEVVSLLTLRVLVEDDSAEHVERTIFAATPVGACENWIGPLRAGEVRRFPVTVRRIVGDPKVSVEVTEVRVWNGPVNAAAASLDDDNDDQDELPAAPPAIKPTAELTRTR